jgi:hypothetical protein
LLAEEQAGVVVVEPHIGASVPVRRPASLRPFTEDMVAESFRVEDVRDGQEHHPAPVAPPLLVEWTVAVDGEEECLVGHPLASPTVGATASYHGIDVFGFVVSSR